MQAQCKQRIKILLLFSYSVGERNAHHVLLSFLFSFYFLNALQRDSNSYKFMLDYDNTGIFHVFEITIQWNE